jgi:hypothetical protein
MLRDTPTVCIRAFQSSKTNDHINPFLPLFSRFVSRCVMNGNLLKFYIDLLECRDMPALYTLQTDSHFTQWLALAWFEFCSYYPIETECLLREVYVFTAILKNVLGRPHKTYREAALQNPYWGNKIHNYSGTVELKWKHLDTSKKISLTLRDFRLPPRSRWEPRSSGVLRCK